MTTDPTKNALINQIDLGFQVEAFLQSDIGKYITQRAEAEVDAAVEALKVADPAKPDEIRAIQHQIHVAESIQYWLVEAYQAGINAQQQLHELEGE